MGLYSNWNHLAPLHQPSRVDVTAWPNTWGGVIKRAATMKGISVFNTLGMKNLLQEFQQAGWTWNPGAAGRGLMCGKAWLDYQVGTGHGGECGWIGWALHTLLITPKPYGFGIPAAQCPIREYSGEATAGNNGYGFVADHALGGHFNLGANVSTSLNPAVLTPFYYWGDHVVVEYLGRFWDPSYNKSYANITDMAAYRCALVPVVDFRIGTGDFAAQMNPRAGGGAVWYKSRRPTEAAYHAQCRYIGPYAANPLPALVPVVAQDDGCCCVIS
ncbi:MAG TPA: hypothetical protein VN493_21180 [Thermoanaerobaculia bacterium]|nr:hypothetical protein [Thermoanaerobaculia bacterium]